MTKNHDLKNGDNKYANKHNHNNVYNPFKRSLMFARMNPQAKHLFAVAVSRSADFFEKKKADFFANFGNA